MRAIQLELRRTPQPQHSLRAVLALLALAEMFLVANRAPASQPGALDPDFNPGGGVDQSVFALTLQSDGRLIITGDFTNVNGSLRGGVARLNSNGALDQSFDPGTGANDEVHAVALQT